MPVELSDFVESLKREVTPPGNDLSEGVDDAVFTGYLADSFWEARLDGFAPRWTCDVGGSVTPEGVANQVSEVYVKDDASGPGTLMLVINGEETAPFTSDADAVDVQSAVEGLSFIDSVTVTGSGAEGDPWLVEFSGDQVKWTSFAVSVKGGDPLDSAEVATRVVQGAVGGEDFPRELVGLVILYAGIKILRNRIMTLNTSFRSKAGPVEYEVQNSANLLTELLKQLARRREELLEEVKLLPTPTFYLDAYAERGHNRPAYWGETGQFLASLAS